MCFEGSAEYVAPAWVDLPFAQRLPDIILIQDIITYIELHLEQLWFE